MDSKKYKSAASRFFDETDEVELTNKEVDTINVNKKDVPYNNSDAKTEIYSSEDYENEDLEYEEEYEEEYDDEEYEEYEDDEEYDEDDEYDEDEEYEDEEYEEGAFAGFLSKLKTKKAKYALIGTAVAIVLITVISIVVISTRVDYVENVVVYVDGSEVKTFERVEEGTLEQKLIDAGYDEENYKRDDNQKSTDTKIYLVSKKEITLTYSVEELDREKFEVYSYKLNDVLTELELDIDDTAIVYVDNVKIDSRKYEDTVIRQSSSIKIVTNSDEVITEDEVIPYGEKVIEDPSLPTGERKVTVKGVNGVKRITYNVYYSDGKEISREIVKTEIIKEAVTEEISIGTKPKEETVPAE